MKYNFDTYISREGTNCFKYDYRKVLFGNDKLIPMWVADMDFPTPDFIREALVKRIDHPILGYSLKSDAYYESIIKWLKRRHHWEIDKSWISFSPGVVPGLTIAVMAFTNPGDKVIVQTPVYFPFFSSIEGPGRQIVSNPLKLVNGRYQMNFDDLISKIDEQTKMLFLCNPHNPGGMVWHREELDKLSGICYDHDILIISDEIHSDLVFKPNQHLPLASILPEFNRNVITFMAPSKTFNMAGLSSSFVIIPDPKRKQVYNKLLEYMHLHIGNIFGDIGLEAAYTHGDEWLDQLLDYLKGNIEYVCTFLERNIPKIKPMRPEGTYLIWLDCRELGKNDSELNHFMINKAGIGLNNGTMFGEGGSGFQRMNIACPRSVVKKSMDLLKSAVEGLR